jgi:hypothetical protein
MFMRMTTARALPEKLAAGLVAFRKGLRSDMPAASVLVDHATGTVITMSRWATREAAETVSEFTPILQRQLVGLFGISEPLTHEIFEVAVDAQGV